MKKFMVILVMGLVVGFINQNVFATGNDAGVDYTNGDYVPYYIDGTETEKELEAVLWVTEDTHWYADYNDEEVIYSSSEPVLLGEEDMKFDVTFEWDREDDSSEDPEIIHCSVVGCLGGSKLDPVDRTATVDIGKKICLNAQDDYKTFKYTATVVPSGTTASLSAENGVSADVTTDISDGATITITGDSTSDTAYTAEITHVEVSDSSEKETGGKVFEFKYKSNPYSHAHSPQTKKFVSSKSSIILYNKGKAHAADKNGNETVTANNYKTVKVVTVPQGAYSDKVSGDFSMTGDSFGIITTGGVLGHGGISLGSCSMSWVGEIYLDCIDKNLKDSNSASASAPVGGVILFDITNINFAFKINTTRIKTTANTEDMKIGGECSLQLIKGGLFHAGGGNTSDGSGGEWLHFVLPSDDKIKNFKIEI